MGQGGGGEAAKATVLQQSIKHAKLIFQQSYAITKRFKTSNQRHENAKTSKS